MDFFSTVFQWVDAFLIAPYRWPQYPAAGWWLGTALLAVWCTLLGEFTLAVCHRANRDHLRRVTRQTLEHHEQSLNALKAGDKEAYKSINRLANDAYGKTFFLQIAMASSALWPVALALGWLDLRFSEVEFTLPAFLPLAGGSVKYPFIFLPLYILTRILFSEARRRLKTQEADS
ncbi:MAG: hypothetical protein JRF59_05625 [Deltaproteobacteria bacterium]|nr:hypothetical protein [Deltaproteobacteria bacterium]MBW1922209.1 hypothetical protein [Deltaproteobacteria bacterium]MBW1948647.1 hypothetical protein [Deltaproteobacteria bacterium]MBW2006809.1 hypothetical protein [Deltaproteobacteria bacterium]MBW2101091.1 hypothetical protein [Deltaproteobacteria bacterium]